MIIWDNDNPTPFKDMINQVICGDCLDVMKYIPDKSVDLVLTDPPYGINFKSSRQTYQDHIENDRFEDWISILPIFLKEFKRVLVDLGCCCCCCCCGGGGKTPVTAIFTIESINHFKIIQTLVWRKFIGLGWRYRPSYENIVILAKDEKNYNFYDESKSCSNVIEGINQDIPKNKYQHPTQKPVELMEHLIKIHTKEGDIVLDAFNGGGSTLEACKKLNRKFIGIEKELKYCQITERRLAQEYLF